MKDRIIHKCNEAIPNDGNIWHLYTACKIKVPQYNCSYIWKKVTCKNCLKLKPLDNQKSSASDKEK